MNRPASDESRDFVRLIVPARSIMAGPVNRSRDTERAALVLATISKQLCLLEDEPRQEIDRVVA